MIYRYHILSSNKLEGKTYSYNKLTTSTVIYKKKRTHANSLDKRCKKPLVFKVKTEISQHQIFDQTGDYSEFSQAPGKKLDSHHDCLPSTAHLIFKLTPNLSQPKPPNILDRF